MQPSDRACIALAAAIITWDTLCPPGQTISEAIDRYLIAHRLAAEIALAAIYLHLSNRLPTRLDPIHGLFCGLKALRAAII